MAVSNRSSINQEAQLYDQSENEWIIVLEGAGTVLFEDGREVSLKKGDYLTILSHSKHKEHTYRRDHPSCLEIEL